MLESSKALNECGAGIQVSPNDTRIVSAWGVMPTLEKVAHEPKFAFVRRYDMGDVRVKIATDDTYGSP